MSVLRGLAGRPSLGLAGGFLLAIVIACALAPVWCALLGVDPIALPADPARAAGVHLLGQDVLGRDLLARLLYGGRASLTIALFAGLLSSSFGAVIGLGAGLRGGLADRALLRTTEAFSSVPRLPLMLILAGAGLAGFPLLRPILIIALFGWMGEARLARAAARRLVAEDFVLAARALGLPAHRVILGHLLPNAASPLLVSAATSLGEILLYESVLSFLGLGVPPPAPSWGSMLGIGMLELERAPAGVVLPGLLTLFTIAAIQALGDGLRDALDPRARAG